MDTDKKLEGASFRDFFQAHEEAAKQRASLAEEGYAVRVEKSPYSGYRVRKTPVEFLLDDDLAMPSLNAPRTKWGSER